MSWIFWTSAIGVGICFGLALFVEYCRVQEWLRKKRWAAFIRKWEREQT